MHARHKPAPLARPHGASALSQRHDENMPPSALEAAATAAAAATAQQDASLPPPRAQASPQSRVLHLAVDVAATQAALRQCIAAAERRARGIIDETRSSSAGGNGGDTAPSDAVDRMRSVLSRAKRSMLLLMTGQRRAVRQFCVDEGVSPALLPRLYADPAERRRKRRAAAAAVAAAKRRTSGASVSPPSPDGVYAATPPVARHSGGSARGSGEHVPVASSGAGAARGSRHGEASDYAPSPAVRGVVAPEPATPEGAPAVASSWELRMLHRTRRHLKHRIRE